MQRVEQCLVTGADGFIGSVLSHRLSEEGVRVLRLVHRSDGPDTLAVDLGRDPVPSLDDFQPEAVFHLAGRVHQFDQWTDSQSEHIRVTEEGTRDLLAASIRARVQSFVFFSTCAVMPVGLPCVVDESVEPRPITPYACAKLSAEQLVIGMNGTGGLRTACLRLPMVYGPGHKGQLPRMIRAIETGWFPPIPDLGGGRSLVHVEDAVAAALLVARSPQAAGKVYIVAEPRPYTSRELYEIILGGLGRRPPTWHLPRIALIAAAYAGDAIEKSTRRRMPFDSEALRKLLQPAHYSAARIERELGFRPTRSFASSVHELTGSRPH
ncbi:MAG: NAD-dependent epimerase/dehydratase family protein [Candidatus Dormibacteraceae bacterium]